MTSGEGVDAVFEMLGGEHTLKSVKCLREFGSASFTAPPQENRDVRSARCSIQKNSVHGLCLSVLAGNKKVMDQRGALSQWIAATNCGPIVGHVFSDGAGHRRVPTLLDRQNFGKVCFNHSVIKQMCRGRLARVVLRSLLPLFWLSPSLLLRVRTTRTRTLA